MQYYCAIHNHLMNFLSYTVGFWAKLCYCIRLVTLLCCNNLEKYRKVNILVIKMAERVKIWIIELDHLQFLYCTSFQIHISKRCGTLSSFFRTRETAWKSGLYNIDMEICRKDDQPKLPLESPSIKLQIFQLSKLYANLS